jgi:hypothetical protein
MQMDDDEFAEWSENALWLHSQMQMLQQANTMNAMGAAFGQKKR